MRTTSGRRTTSTLMVSLLIAATSSASGQSAIYGAGLQAWLGCWSADLSSAPAGTAPTIVRITPTPSVDVADVSTIQDGRLLPRETLDATGRPRPIDAARCTGERSARWSRDGRRLFVHSIGTCAGVSSSTSGLLAIGADGDWIDIEAISAGGGSSVRVARYREVAPPVALPVAARAALRAQSLATRSLRAAAAAPVRAEDVLEAARALDPAVVDAWILERAQHFDVTQTDLAALTNLGVPARITDALVAVADPQSYALTRGVEDAPTVAQMSTYDESYALPLGWGWGWGLAIPVGTRFGSGGYRGARRSGFYRPPNVIARGHDGRPRGRGDAGQGHGRDGRDGRTGGYGDGRDGRDGRGDGQRQNGTSRPPAGDPRRAPSTQPSGGTVRLGRP